MAGTPSEGSRTAGFGVCVVLGAPIVALLGFWVVGLALNPAVIVTALCIGAVWRLRAREIRKN